MTGTTFKFTPPPEAPIFYPTAQEFEDPILYINKIKPIGFKTGICKIIPPKGWNPPFAVDINAFKFTPRVQRLYELEAHSRIKLDFISKLYQFNRLQGNAKLKIPSIGGKYLDVFWLHKYVDKAGGYDKVTATKSWSKIAVQLGHGSGKCTQLIKSSYERLLLPYDLVTKAKPESNQDEKQHQSKRLRTSSHDATTIDYDANKELQNLRFFGPGPKAAVPTTEQSATEKSRLSILSPTNSYSCRVCNFDNEETSLLICSTESCQACYHIFCLTPPLTSIPKWKWKCPECVRQLCSRPMDLYGFPQSPRPYTLQEFGVRADAFKAKYFRQEPSSVPCSTVETEFWRILQEYTEDVVVEYGADIHSSDQGSGFPTELQLRTHPKMFPKEEQKRKALGYAQSPWNLNNLPVFGNSVLRFIKGNIDGMKVPWCYVGMVFSAFCWHIEDHWSCSINFMHWGEPKTWYGVSSQHAEAFEVAMRQEAGELFELSPDLLHHITTIMNPNVLQAHGVPIFRTDQHCGEFVITFPRAYHAGFNQGFNFAEAVNICGPDWLPMGRSCVEHYASMKRQCVFSNDELLLILAETVAGERDIKDVVAWTDLTAERFTKATPLTTGFDADNIRIIHDEFSFVLERERALREHLIKAGLTNVEDIRLDELSDDERVCFVCQTTLFFSAVTCPCKGAALEPSFLPGRTKTRKRKSTESQSCSEVEVVSDNQSTMVCLKHAESVCTKCPLNQCLARYTFTIEQLETTLSKLTGKLAAYEAWHADFSRIFSLKSRLQSFASEKDEAEEKVEELKEQDDTEMDLTTFENRLKEAELFGYQNDILFKRANAYLASIHDILEVCEKAASLVLDTLPVDTSAINKTPTTFDGDESHTLGFLVKRPTTFTVSSGSADCVNKTFLNVHCSIDLKHPREIDILRLLEAVQQEEKNGPVRLCSLPSIQLLHSLVCSLQEWRAKARSTITASRSLLPTNLAAKVCSSVKVEPSVGSVSTLEDIQNKFGDLVRELQDKFPGWCKHMEELQLIVLLEGVCTWLVKSSRLTSTDDQTSDTKIQWTISDLREHLSGGESFIAKLASADACSTLGSSAGVADLANTGRVVGNRLLRSVADSKSPTKGVLAGHPSPPSATGTANRLNTASVISVVHPVIRQLRPRLHTAIGQVSQILVNVDSLVLMLADAVQIMHFATPSASSEVTACSTYIQQLRAQGISQLGATCCTPDVVPATPKPSMMGVCCSPSLYDSHVKQMEKSGDSDEVRLVYWWSVQTASLLSHAGVPCIARPAAWLSDVSDLIAVQQFVFGDTLQSSSTSCVSPELAELHSSFTRFQLEHLAATRSLASYLHPSGSQSLDLLPVDMYNQLIQATLPKVLEKSKYSLSLVEIDTAVLSQDFGKIEDLILDLIQMKKSDISSFLDNVKQGNLHCSCSKNRNISPIKTTKIEESKLSSDCPVCQFLTHEETSAITIDLVNRLAVEPSSSLSNASDFLVHGVKICIRHLLNRHHSWMIDVGKWIESNRLEVARVLASERQAFEYILPAPLGRLIEEVRATETANADTAPSSDFVQGLRALILSSCPLLDRPVLNFIQAMAIDYQQ